jgi:arabinan endo-1,5-alpha-L-arabinosidase
MPNWTRQLEGGDLWAPDASYHDGVYWLYYTAAGPGSERAIGLATSTTAEPGSWQDKGHPVIRSTARYNAMDPDLLVEPNGRRWLTFGSNKDGIFVVEIDRGTGEVESGATPQHVASPAGDGVTAAAMYRHAGYYYLLAAYGSCCPPLGLDANPTSRILVGRATSPTGEFRDRDGVRLLDGGGSELRGWHQDARGPGGPSIVHDAHDDADLLVYHYYDPRLGYAPFLGINRVEWDAGGWPHLP